MMKKFLSLLLILVLLTGLGLHALADGSKVVLSLYVQNEGIDAVLVRRYTADELAALGEKTDGAAYIFYRKGVANAVVAKEYVTLDALLGDAVLDFGPAQWLAFECTDGPYDKGDFSHETLSQRGVDLNGDAVPTAIALAWAEDSLDETTVPDIAAKAENTGNLRFVCGMTAEEAEEKIASGDRMPMGVVSITIVTPK